MYIAASGNWLKGTLALASKSHSQSPCMKNWVMHRAEPQRMEGTCAIFPQCVRMWMLKVLTALVKSQGQGGPSRVSFALFLLLSLWKVHASFKPNSYIKAESHCMLCRQTWEAACLKLPGWCLASWEDRVLLSPAHWPAFVFGHIVSSPFQFLLYLTVSRLSV